MAAGDIVNGIFTTTATNHTFQPAAGVEVMITFVAGSGLPTRGGLSNGVNTTQMIFSDNADFSEGGNVKIGINNTNFLVVYGETGAPGYSGIKIK